jgi:aspartyl-tRNA(Asn)/glutamyl-tRNA(Gln) amidotransferase subunit A
MADFTDIFFAGITEVGNRLRAKEFSALELTRAFCDRLERFGARFNALALGLRESALRQARTVDDDLKNDRTRGPLQGIPYGVKDLLAVKGNPTTWGARPFAGQVFPDDARVVEKLNKVGAILVGKLSMVELAGGGGYRSAGASMTGPGLNPWDRSRWSGGSSSGSGAATAAGLVTFALGSETSGSILTPSAYCGVTGLRPTYGLVSRRGAMSLSWTLDKIGPMCRSAEDCGLVLSVIAGGDTQDSGSAGRGFQYAPQFAHKPADIRVGWAPVDFNGWAEPDTRAAFQTALGVFRSLRVQLKEVKLPEYPYGSLLNIIMGAEASSIFEEFIRSERIDRLADPVQIAGLKSYLDIPAADYLRAMRVRALVQEDIRKLFLDVDMLLTPTRMGVANRISDPLDAEPPGPYPDSVGLFPLIPAANLAGLPAISLPCGFVNGLPIGISLVGRPFYENQLIGLGRAFQTETDWHKHRPMVS